VVACNNDGLWNKNPVTISFVVKPPWYMTWTAYFVFGTIAVSLIFLLMRIRTRKLIREKQNLEKIIAERTQEIVHQKHQIEEKQNEILDSINYAQRIQRSMLASEKLLKNHLTDYFILYLPKDIVSGDFYWASVLSNGEFALLIADSTGHGVPGAIMSMLNIACLNEAVDGFKLVQANDILNSTRVSVIKHLSNDGSIDGGKDGMDCSLLVIDGLKLKFAGANNPVWIVRKNELIELEPDRMPVGKHERDSFPFNQLLIDLLPEDMVYALTDGYPDQFGGPKGKKFMYKQLKDLLINISTKPINEQKEILSKCLLDWKGSAEQVDDITIIGFRI
jgi:serine phosphatase RsbU (regulator of sigma subunit)